MANKPVTVADEYSLVSDTVGPTGHGTLENEARRLAEWGRDQLAAAVHPNNAPSVRAKMLEQLREDAQSRGNELRDKVTKVTAPGLEQATARAFRVEPPENATAIMTSLAPFFQARTTIPNAMLDEDGQLYDPEIEQVFWGGDDAIKAAMLTAPPRAVHVGNAWKVLPVVRQETAKRYLRGKNTKEFAELDAAQERRDKIMFLASTAAKIVAEEALYRRRSR
jgi:hypothetical protein